MAHTYQIKKVLNNNVLIAADSANPEVVLIGKGIGFGKKSGDEINTSSVEKLFTLVNEEEQTQYKQLLFQVHEDFIGFMHDIISYMEDVLKAPMNEHIHIALTDHIAFAIKRAKQGLDIRNPFLVETQTLYPREYEVAEEVIRRIDKRYNLHLPEGEIGFIALHIHSSLTNRHLSEINKYSSLINELVELVEQDFKMKISRSSVDYLRLVRHLRHTIDRVNAGEKVKEPKKLAEILKQEYPLCYNISWKLMKVMQQRLRRSVYDAEAVYLTMHLQRLSTKE